MTLIKCLEDRIRSNEPELPLGTHVKPQAQLELFKGCLHGCRRDGWAISPQRTLTLTLPRLALVPWGISSLIAWSWTALEEKLHTQSQQTPQALFYRPLANCGCSLDAHLHSITHWLGKGPGDTGRDGGGADSPAL